MSKSESDTALHTELPLSFEQALARVTGVLKVEEYGSRAISLPGA